MKKHRGAPNISRHFRENMNYNTLSSQSWCKVFFFFFHLEKKRLIHHVVHLENSWHDAYFAVCIQKCLDSPISISSLAHFLIYNLHSEFENSFSSYSQCLWGNRGEERRGEGKGREGQSQSNWVLALVLDVVCEASISPPGLTNK